MFLHADNEIPENEIKEKIPFMAASKTIRYVGINLTTEAKDLWSKNYKTPMMRDIEEGTSDGTVSCVYGSEELIV